MKKKKKPVWTDARVARLKALWADGLSASQIADELGGRITRNAVLGKVHRLQLPTRKTKTRAPVRPSFRSTFAMPIHPAIPISRG